MESRLSTGSPSRAFPSTPEKPARIDLWVGSVPTADKPSFKSLIQRQTGATGSQGHVSRPFEPKDEHCGTWEDAPDEECHASFGDQGTTASVSCYGNLIQMSQFLGVGHSGVFSIDHKSTEKPYFVVQRAYDLNKLAEEAPGADVLSFGLDLPKRFRPQKVPKIKWVNWKWPRYEWKVRDDGISAQVSSQWLVKNNTVLQQVVITNKGNTSIRDFQVRTSQHMLIRDLDYLQGSYFSGFRFNDDDSKSYLRGLGPNDLSWITANVLESGKPATSQGDGAMGEFAGQTSEINHRREGSQSPGVRDDISEEKLTPPSLKLTSGESVRPRMTSSQEGLERDLPAGDAQSIGTNDVRTKQQQHSIEEGRTVEKLREHDPNEQRPPPSDDGMWQKRRISDTWSAKDTYAVVSVMSLFVNGIAEKIGTEHRPIPINIEAAGSSSSMLEITVAYRTIAVPKGSVHWKNFLIPAEAADVDVILAAETKDLWGHSVTDDCKCSQSLCDLGLSMVDLNKRNVTKDASDEGQTPQDSRTDIANLGAQKSTKGHEDTATIANSQMEVKTGARESSTAAEPSNEHNEAQDPSERPITGVTVVDSQKLSPVASAIEYLIWRHTEHILSVCAIPLSAPHLSQEDKISEATLPAPDIATSNKDASKGKLIELEVPLALTCGDMSGHRVCTSAGFFAFEFLMDVLRRLPLVKQTPYVVSLQHRIDTACRGHIRWLEWVRKPWLTLEDTESLLRSGCFAANYWVDGKMMPSGSPSWQPDDSVTDTPYHVLKVTSYIKWLKTSQDFQSSEDHGLGHYMALLRDVWACWIHELDDLDKRKACAWRHTSEDGLNIYRLDDHFWLWNSLSELHELGLWNLTNVSNHTWKHSPDRWISNIYSLSPAVKLDDENPRITTKEARISKELAEFSSTARRLLPKEVQRAVLQRFTVENDVSQERMLAVTRSARDTRFFFHTRDTALFYGHKRGFFRLDTSFSELWERTIKSQSHHEEALEAGWSSPLRAALGAVAGLNNFSIDKRNSAELARRSVEDLIQVSAHNAFIPGEVDVATRKRSTFSEERDRDYYYHVGFEACHILLAYAKDIDVVLRSEQIRITPPDALTEKFEGLSRQFQHFLNEFDERQERRVQREKQFMDTVQYGSDFRASAKLETDGRFNRKRASMAMKRSMPFNNMIDASSITTLDDEWLYNYPEFLLAKSIDLSHQLELLFDKKSTQYERVYESVSSIIDKALASLKGIPPENFFFTRVDENSWENDGLVASLPKQKTRRQKRGTRDIGAALDGLPVSEFNEALWNLIGKARSAIKAKKRFLWLPARSNPQTALLCWLASTEAEKPAISLFFDRHAEYDNHLWDDTTMVLNTWQTELHMCFWIIYDKRQQLHMGLPHPVVAPWPKDSHKELRRASIGFRFDGDFFDRYWTCHFIQYVPGLPVESSGTPPEWFFRFGYEKQTWQRKVLELQLLEYVLNLILTGSNKILKDIQNELGLKKGSLIFSVLTTEAYSLSADHWQTYEALLEKAEEDIASSLNTLSKWATREGDRGQERPRWTRNDERKYRGSINKLRNHTERQRWDLESCRDKMCKLRETLITRQDKIRVDLEASREQNIRYFTYVTVIFLPLGFASSFYSMNGAPSNDLIVSLAKFAAAAFAVTVILLFSVSMANQAMLQPLQQYSLDIRQHSLLVKGTPNNDEPDKTKMLHQTYSKKDWMVSSWFWPAYLFLELPTRTISSAWTTLETRPFLVGAVWRVALGFVILPVYVFSLAILISFRNAVLLLRISRHLYRLYTKRLSEDDRRFVKKWAAKEFSGGQVLRRWPSFGDASEDSGDAEEVPTEGGAFLDHFKELMPSPDLFNPLQSLEHRLNQRMDAMKWDEVKKALDKA